MFDPGNMEMINDTMQNLLTTCYVADVLNVLHIVIHVAK